MENENSIPHETLNNSARYAAACKDSDDFKLINDEVRIETTNRCNATCIMCPREKMKRPQGIMDMGLYQRIVDQAVKAGARQISLDCFGETFIDPLIFKRAQYAKSKGMRTHTITNAALLDKQKTERILKLFDVIRISLYGTTKKTYECIHRGLNYEKVKTNVERLFEMRRKIPECQIKIEMYFLLMDENKKEMDDFLKTYEPICDAVAVWKPHNWGNARQYRKLNEKKVSCNRPFSGPLQVQWDGCVVPCCFDFDNTIILGNLKTQSIQEVLTGEKYNQLRRAHRQGNFAAFPFCDTCDQLNKRGDVLVYTNIKNAKVGSTNTTHFDLKEKNSS